MVNKINRYGKFFVFLPLVLIISFCFLLTGCSSSIELTTKNIEDYLAISYSITYSESSKGENYTQCNYTCTTYSLSDKYTFENVTVQVGVSWTSTNSYSSNKLSTNGYGSFYFTYDLYNSSLYSDKEPYFMKVSGNVIVS